MTFEQAFLKVKEKFDNADASKVADFAIQITLRDEDCGGTLYAEVKDGKLAVEPYDYKDNNLALNITKAALISALGRSSLDKAIANGDAEVYGDASKFADLKATIKKTAAKKPAAKKTTAKKTTTAAKKTTAKATAAKKPAAKKTPAKKAAPAAKTVAPAKTEVKTTSAAVKTEAKTAAAKTTVAKTTTTAKKN